MWYLAHYRSSSSSSLIISRSYRGSVSLAVSYYLNFPFNGPGHAHGPGAGTKTPLTHMPEDGLYVLEDEAENNDEDDTGIPGRAKGDRRGLVVPRLFEASPRIVQPVDVLIPL